jgi:TolB-like protein/class 3 adenylate cyclase/Tfp pilus assembly protein PilF
MVCYPTHSVELPKTVCYDWDMAEARKIAAVLFADVVGFSRMVGQDEDRTLSRLRGLRSDLIDPAIAAHRGRVVKRTGDGALVEFRTSVDALRCALEVQEGMIERNAGVSPERRITFRIGIHVGEVVEESDGDLMGDTVNIAARLEGICEPEGVVVSEDVYRQVREKVQSSFLDQGEIELKNIHHPVRVYRVANKDPATGDQTKEFPSNALRLPAKPSIAVLPFQNMSGDPEQEYFADGIVDEITTCLSRIRWLFVIARNSSFIYKGKTVDVRQVGRELGVRYVVEGGVRKSGQRVRITAQLVETATGNHLWADRFDGALEDMFDLQDQITEKVVAVVEPSVQRSEIARARQKRPESLDAYDLYLRAVPFTASQSAEEGKIAIELLERALTIDPEYAAAHALVAWCYEWCYSRGGFDDVHKASALRHAQAAMSGSTDDATALAVAGWVTSMLTSDHAAGLDAIERALKINPSCATALYVAAANNAFSGRPAAALDYAERAIRLSPFDLLVAVGHAAQGVSLIQLERYKEASIAHDRSVQANPTLSSFRFLAACAHALAGDLEAARTSAQRGLEMEPSFRIRFFYELMIPELADRFANGARLIGLRE